MDVKQRLKPTTLQLAGFQERRIALRRRIEHFRELQAVYMPGLRQALPDPTVLDDSSDILAEAVSLYLPSQLSDRQRVLSCTSGISAAEGEIRLADASEALEDLRRHLRTRTYLNQWKVKNVSGQRPNTRARALQHQVDIKVHASKTQYRRARQALYALRGPGGWENDLKELRDSDVRALNEREMTAQEMHDRECARQRGVREDNDASDGVVMTGNVATGEGRRMLSWIWYSTGESEDENSPGMHEGN